MLGSQAKTDKDRLQGCEDDEGLGHLSGGKAEGAGTAQHQGKFISGHKHLKGGSLYNRCSSVISAIETIVQLLFLLPVPFN